jgi:hypothetical protein
MPENLWRYLMDEDQQKLQDLKLAPLIHEVSDWVVCIIFSDSRRPDI